MSDKTVHYSEGVGKYSPCGFGTLWVKSYEYVTCYDCMRILMENNSGLSLNDFPRVITSKSPKDPDPPPMPERPVSINVQRMKAGLDPVPMPERPEPKGLQLRDKVYIRTHDQLKAAGAVYLAAVNTYGMLNEDRTEPDSTITEKMTEYLGTQQCIVSINTFQNKPTTYNLHSKKSGYIEGAWQEWMFMDIDDRIERLKDEQKQASLSTSKCEACNGDLVAVEYGHNDMLWQCVECSAQYEMGTGEDLTHFVLGHRVDISGDGLAGGALGEEPTCDEDPSGIEKEKHVVHFKLDTPNSQAACGCWGHYVFVTAISAVTCDACIVALEASGRVINLVKHVDSLDAANKLGPMETELQQEPDEKLPWDEFKKDCPHCNKRMLAFIERDRVAKPLECSLHQTGDGRPVFRQMYNTSDYLVLHHMCHSCGHSEAERQYDDGRKETLT